MLVCLVSRPKVKQGCDVNIVLCFDRLYALIRSLRQCEIASIEPKAFEGVPALEYL